MPIILVFEDLEGEDLDGDDGRSSMEGLRETIDDRSKRTKNKRPTFCRVTLLENSAMNKGSESEHTFALQDYPPFWLEFFY